MMVRKLSTLSIKNIVTAQLIINNIVVVQQKTIAAIVPVPDTSIANIKPLGYF